MLGEGLNTAFAATEGAAALKNPEIVETGTRRFIVHIRHSPLASPQDAVIFVFGLSMTEITNSVGRELTGIRSENSMKEFPEPEPSPVDSSVLPGQAWE